MDVREAERRAAFENVRRRQQRAIRRELLTARADLLVSPSVTPADRNLLAGVSVSVDPADPLFMRGEAEHYLRGGLSAVHCLRRALAHAGGEDAVASVLDFAAGYGRTSRFLRAMFPAAVVAAADVDARALRFCRRALSVATITSVPEPAQFTAGRPFDLIWCGAFLTQVDQQACAGWLSRFHDHLSPGGVCVVSTHGAGPVTELATGAAQYSLSAPARRQVVSAYRTCGYGHAEFDAGSGLGVAVISRERLLSLAGQAGAWREILFLEQGWMGQDVYAFAKR